MIARAGDGVSAAKLTLEDGTEVTATVQNGWAVAWWPGSHQVTGAQLTTSTGTQTQTFPLSAMRPAQLQRRRPARRRAERRSRRGLTPVRASSFRTAAERRPF